MRSNTKPNGKQKWSEDIEKWCFYWLVTSLPVSCIRKVCAQTINEWRKNVVLFCYRLFADESHHTRRRTYGPGRSSDNAVSIITKGELNYSNLYFKIHQSVISYPASLSFLFVNVFRLTFLDLGSTPQCNTLFIWKCWRKNILIKKKKIKKINNKSHLVFISENIIYLIEPFLTWKIVHPYTKMMLLVSLFQNCNNKSFQIYFWSKIILKIIHSVKCNAKFFF